MGCGLSTGRSKEASVYAEDQQRALRRVSQRYSVPPATQQPSDLFAVRLSDIKMLGKGGKAGRRRSSSAVRSTSWEGSHPHKVSKLASPWIELAKMGPDNSDDMRRLFEGDACLRRSGPSRQKEGGGKDGPKPEHHTSHCKVSTQLGPPFSLLVASGEVPEARRASGGASTSASLKISSTGKILNTRVAESAFRGCSLRYLVGFSRPVVAMAISPCERTASLVTRRGRPLPVSASQSDLSIGKPIRGSFSSLPSSALADGLAKACKEAKVVNFEKAIRQIDLRTGAWVGLYKEGCEVLTCTDMAYLRDGQHLVTGSHEGCTRIFQTDIPKVKKEFVDEEDVTAVGTVACSNDKKHTACSVRMEAGGSGVIVYAIEPMRALTTFTAHECPVVTLAFHPSLPVIASACRHRTLLWKIDDGGLLQALPSLGEHGVRSLAFSSDATLYTMESRTIQCWAQIACRGGEPTYELTWTKMNDVAKPQRLDAGSVDDRTAGTDSISLNSSYGPSDGSAQQNRRIFTLPGRALLLLSSSPAVTILDATTGDVLGEVHLRDAPVAAAVGRTMALISDKSGNVYALDISTVCQTSRPPSLSCSPLFRKTYCSSFGFFFSLFFPSIFFAIFLG
eukprot:Rhum_TRINITY_DN9063_c0_g1::Rhum_TRINITY_DN9063_c0_g1_i1::g.31370::m.31370